MLIRIREHAKGVFAWIIVLAIVVPLAFFGVYNYVSGPQSSEVAMVNGQPITLDAVNNVYQQERRRLEQRFGGQLPPGLINEQELRRRALDQLINDAVVQRFVQKEHLRISDAQLASILHANPDFQEGGQFSPTLYHGLLKSAGMTAPAYEARIRAAEAIDQLQRGIYSTAFATPQAADELLKLQRQERDLSYLVVEASAFRDQVTVSDQEVEEYYKTHLQDYQRPAQVKLAYLELDPRAIGQQAQISEDELKARYEAEKAQFTTPGSREVRHIFIQLPQDAKADDVEKAKAQLEQWRTQIVQNQASFPEIAKQHSQDTGTAKEGGSLGEVHEGDTPPAFEKAAFALKEGEISEPVRTEHGLHLIQVTKISPQVVKPFEEVVAQLREEAAKDLASRRIAELSNQLANLTYEHPDSLEAAAQAMGLQVKHTDWISRGARAEGIGGNPKVMEAAFSEDVLRNGRNSSVIELDNDHQVVVRVEEHKPAEPRPLAEVASTVRDRLTREKLAAAAQELGKRLESQAAAGEPLEKLATGPAKLSTPGFTGRGSDKVPMPILQAAFRLQKPAEGKASVGSTELPSGDYVVIKVAGVRDGQAEGDVKQAQENVRTQLANLYGNATIDEMVRVLRENSDIEIHEDRL